MKRFRKIATTEQQNRIRVLCLDLEKLFHIKGFSTISFAIYSYIWRFENLKTWKKWDLNFLISNLSNYLLPKSFATRHIFNFSVFIFSINSPSADFHKIDKRISYLLVQHQPHIPLCREEQFRLNHLHWLPASVFEMISYLANTTLRRCSVRLSHNIGNTKIITHFAIGNKTVRSSTKFPKL